MAITKMFGHDFASASVSGTGGAQNVLPYLNTFEFRPGDVDQENTALLDGFVTHAPVRTDDTISFTLVGDSAGNAIFTNLAANRNKAVTFSFVSWTSGQTYAGSGVLKARGHTIPDGGQTLSYELNNVVLS